ncbi:MAG: M23 family metallopeptidase [Bacteroidales bacterium]|nr:M23 family metallopeptidase [Bacteroidales bacterium]
MEELNKKQKRKLHLSIFDAHTFEEVKSLKFSRPLIFSLIGASILIIFGLVFLLLVYTPLNLLIPSKASLEAKNSVIETSLMIDSLERKIISEETYLTQIKNIIQGKIAADTFNVEKLYNDSSIVISKSEFGNSNLDSIIRAELEETEAGVIGEQIKEIKETLKNLHFIVPLKGLVSNEFDAKKSHFGIDIVPGNDETVLAALSGTVILSTWSVETGYIIGIQHNWNLLSLYKHNSVLLKKVGDRVKSGESIAIVGNSGEQTSGKHLHFELWHNGTPTNPRDYITF